MLKNIEKGEPIAVTRAKELNDFLIARVLDCSKAFLENLGDIILIQSLSVLRLLQQAHMLNDIQEQQLAKQTALQNLQKLEQNIKKVFEGKTLKVAQEQLKALKKSTLVWTKQQNVH